MPRLPQPGGDQGTWGDVLNEFLLTAHNADGSLKSQSVIDSVAAKYSLPSGGIPETDLSSSVQTKLNATGTGGGVTAHSALTGLTADDHIIYALADGSRGAFEPAGSIATAVANLYTKPSGGIPETDLDSAAQAKLNAGGSVTSLNDIDGTAVTAAVDFNGQTLNNVPNPTVGTDGANKAYVDLAVGAGGSVPADSVTNVEIAPATVRDSELANNAVTTTKILDGAVTQAKLDTTLSASITAKYVKPGTGIPETDLDSATQAKLNSGGSSVTSLNDIDGTAVTAAVDLNSQKITGLATPTTATDAATKAYVDTIGGESIYFPYLKTSLGIVSTAIQSAYDSTSLSIGDFIRTASYKEDGTRGGCLYQIVTAATGTDDGGSFIDFTGFQLKAIFDGTISIAAFGAIGDAVADDQPAIQAAINFGEITRAEVTLPGGVYRLASSITVSSTMRLAGAGGYSTILLPDPSVTGLVIRNHSRGARQVGDAYYDYGLAESGGEFQGFLVTGTQGDNQTGIVQESQNDRTTFRDVRVSHLDTGWVIGSSFEESPTNIIGYAREINYFNCSVDNCGTLAGSPCMKIDTAVPLGAANGTNHLAFFGLKVLYNPGPFIMTNSDFALHQSQRFTFYDLMLHGRSTAEDAYSDTMIIEGRLADIQFYGLKANNAKAGQAMMRIRAADGYTPTGVIINGSLAGGDGDGVVVEAVSGGQFNLMPVGVTSGDFIRFEASSLDRPVQLNVNSYRETLPSSGGIDINIDATVNEFVHGYWDENSQARLTDTVTGTVYRVSVASGIIGVTAA